MPRSSRNQRRKPGASDQPAAPAPDRPRAGPRSPLHVRLRTAGAGAGRRDHLARGRDAPPGRRLRQEARRPGRDHLGPPGEGRRAGGGRRPSGPGGRDPRRPALVVPEARRRGEAGRGRWWGIRWRIALRSDRRSSYPGDPRSSPLALARVKAGFAASSWHAEYASFAYPTLRLSHGHAGGGLEEGTAVVRGARNPEAAWAFMGLFDDPEPAPSRDEPPGSDQLLADLLGAAFVDAREEQVAAMRAVERAGLPLRWLDWMTQAPPWPPASITRMIERPRGPAATPERLATLLAGDGPARTGSSKAGRSRRGRSTAPSSTRSPRRRAAGWRASRGSAPGCAASGATGHASASGGSRGGRGRAGHDPRPARWPGEAPRQGRRGRRRLDGGEARPADVRARPVGIGQIDAPAPAGGPGTARCRGDLLRRPRDERRPTGGASDRAGLAGRRPLAAPDRRRERRLWPETAWRPPQGAGEAGVRRAGNCEGRRAWPPAAPTRSRPSSAAGRRWRGPW